MRYFLGVHPLTPVPALFGEMGWIQFKFSCWLYLCWTWNRYIDMDNDRLNKKIFMADYYSDTVSWCTVFYEICINLDLQEQYENLEPIDLDIFRKKLEQHAENQWKITMLSKPKLRTYKLFKSSLTPEKYCVYHTSRAKRSVFAQFRCGILPLNIEVGRFRGLKESERLCIFCDQNAIESEIHFLLECPFYSNIRNSLLIRANVQLTDNSHSENIDILMNQYQKITLNHLFDMWLKRRHTILH